MVYKFTAYKFATTRTTVHLYHWKKGSKYFFDNSFKNKPINGCQASEIQICQRLHAKQRHDL